MSYTVIMKADSGLDVEWPPTCLYCGEQASERINLPVGQVDRSMRKAAGRSANFALPYCEEHARQYRLYNRILGGALLFGLALGALLSVLSNLGREGVSILPLGGTKTDPRVVSANVCRMSVRGST